MNWKQSFVHALLVGSICMLMIGLGGYLEEKNALRQWRQPTVEEASRFAFPPDPFNDGFDKSGQRWGWVTNGKGSWMYKQLPGSAKIRKSPGGIQIIIRRD